MEADIQGFVGFWLHVFHWVYSTIDAELLAEKSTVCLLILLVSSRDTDVAFSTFLSNHILCSIQCFQLFNIVCDSVWFI